MGHRVSQKVIIGLSVLLFCITEGGSGSPWYGSQRNAYACVPCVCLCVRASCVLVCVCAAGLNHGVRARTARARV
jgi:hypothetical protein